MRKIALVTGASRGIGRAVALRLARDGFDIWGVYRKSDEQASAVRSEVESAGRSCTMMKFDVSSFAEASDALKPMLEKIDTGQQQLWALVNNAGITRDALLGWMKWEEWREVLSTNLDSVFNITRLAADEMMRQKGGRIVSITSVAGHSGNTGQANYAASKAGIMAFTKSAAKELARMKITVNAVAAGFIESDMTSRLPVDEIRKTIPMRRFGRPEEVAAVVSFLCGEDASYVTGAVIDVNGGIY
jgi:3-oxoacyl-[acyl-carrier protein] reductase